MSTTTAINVPIISGPRAYGRRYWVFAVPAAAIVLLVILFPWLFTLFMSVHDWKVTGATPFVGLANYAKMLQRRTLPVGGRPHAVFHRRIGHRAADAGRLGRRLLRLEVQAPRVSREPCSCCR